jgi:hypothetical protein
VAQRDRTTMKVYLCLVNAKNLHVCECDDTEGLVDLKRVDCALLNSGVLQSLGHGKSWRSGELGGVLCGIAPSNDLANRLEVVLLQRGFRDEYEGGGAIREGRCVRCGDGTILRLEGRAEGAGLGFVELTNVSTASVLHAWDYDRHLTFLGSSSLSTLMAGFPRPPETSIGAISSLKYPASVAAMAFL